MSKKIIFILLLFLYQANAQQKPIKIITEENNNRLLVYAANETEKDYDVLVTITGKNFRQSRAKPRLIRVPATSKVHVKNLILTRGKKPFPKYNLVINDSLSKRALKKPAELIKIKPKKPITIYITNNCTNCDSIINSLNKSPYIFKTHILAEKPKIKSQLEMAFKNTSPLDSINNPIFNLGGKLTTKIENYDQLLEVLHKE